MKYPRLSRFTFHASRLTSRYRCRSERKTYKTVIPRFRKRLYLSGSIGDTTASGFSRLFVFLFSRFLVFAITSILLIAQPVSAQVVEIPDPNLESAIRETLNIPNGTAITQQELLRLTWLDARERGITNLTGLEYATNLEHLEAGDNQISDVRPLAGLIRLQILNLLNNPVKDLTPLANLTALTQLLLIHNRITDISPLANLTNLTHLYLGDNALQTIEPLAGLIHLRVLDLYNTGVKDITPLANLTALESLVIVRNMIADISPLVGLKNLKRLQIAENPIQDFTPLAQLEGVELDLDIDLSRLDQLNLVVEVPDPNLRQAIRETLSLLDGVPLTQLAILSLTNLEAGQRDITDLTGLQYATNLENLQLWGNQIQDVTPLANLTKLRELNLAYNAVESVEPIAGLINLQRLNLTINRVQDITPLANLINLKWLYIRANLVTDITPLQGLNLIEFQYDEICDIPPIAPPVRERIQNRNFPSIFAWGGSAALIGLDHLTPDQRIAHHDLDLGVGFVVGWDQTPTEPAEGLGTSLAGDLSRSRETHQKHLDLNPNIIILYTVSWRSYFTDEILPPGSDFWLRDENGEIVRSLAGSPWLDILKPKVQDLIAKRIIAVERCGLYDGMLLDQFDNVGWGEHIYGVTSTEIIQATQNILRSARSQVREDFLILVNAGRTKVTRYTEYVNGTFMESGSDHAYLAGMPGGFTHEGLTQIESTLLWSEENLRSPQTNCLEGEGIPAEPPDSPENRRWMRVITTLSLTHSDGYVMYTTGTAALRFSDNLYPWGPAHEHIWYSFWDADLGRPIGPQAQPYQNIPGLFIREFTNGWAVYNRSGQAQTISLPQSATGVSSRKSGTTHLLPDLDGEIYLKAGIPLPAEVNIDVGVHTFITEASAQVVSISDPNLEKAVRETLKLPENNPITQLEMLQLTTLDISDSDVTDLTGLEYAPNLNSLNADNNQIQDITPLANLRKLTYLYLSNNAVETLEPLAGSVQLQIFYLLNNPVKDLTPLANLTALTQLLLIHNRVTDISPLANLTNLTHLYLAENPIETVEPLAGLINLRLLDLSAIGVKDITPLANLTALERLLLAGNAIADITPLVGLKNLKRLRLADNPIQDFSPLAQLEGVELDIEVDLSQVAPKPIPADVNGDGNVNILDLLHVTNNFGKSDPDLNGDGVVDILDLTLVGQQFSQ